MHRTSNLVLAIGLGAAMAASLGACASPRAQAMTGARLETAIAAASAHSLGSRANPVRAEGLAGARTYLGRLRCANGAIPRSTNAGAPSYGPFGADIERYELVCDGGDPPAASIFIDAHHAHIESEAPPGFAIMP